jgi:hypothetical protein
MAGAERMGRLNDTAAIAAMGLKSPSACPDGGRAVTTRMAMPGALQYSYDAESGDMVCCPDWGVSRPRVNARADGWERGD